MLYFSFVSQGSKSYHQLLQSQQGVGKVSLTLFLFGRLSLPQHLKNMLAVFPLSAHGGQHLGEDSCPATFSDGLVRCVDDEMHSKLATGVKNEVG